MARRRAALEDRNARGPVRRVRRDTLRLAAALIKIYHTIIVLVDLGDHQINFFWSGINPRVSMSSPSSSLEIVPPPSLSTRLKISLNSASSSGELVAHAGACFPSQLLLV